MSFKKIFLSICIAVMASHAFSQGVIRGFAYDKESGEPMMFVNVYLEGTVLGAATDVNGYYSITRIPAGNYTLLATSLGYDTLRMSVSVSNNDILTRKLILSRNVISLQQVEISAAKEEARTETKVSVNKITPREIKQVPAIGGDPDLAQYLQVLPGVVFSGDQGGQLYIRGGTPIQNKVLLDGMIIYNPFHSIGLFSVFDNDIIKNADIFTGGFGSEYAGRISSIMDITTRDGNKNRFSGKFSANTFSSKLLLEGPYKKAEKEDEGSATFLVSAKTSYLDRTSKSLYKYVEGGGLPYRFNDLYAKSVISSANGSKWSVFGFHFDDRVNYRYISDFNWKTTGFGSNFVLIPGSSPILIDGTVAYSQYKVALQEADDLPRSSLINGFNMGLNFTYFIGKDQVKYGLEVLGFKTNFTYYNYTFAKLQQEENTTEFGSYVKYKKVLGKVVLDGGVRLHYYGSLNEFSPEPRLSAKWNITDRLRMKAASGLYAQNFIAAVSDRDVVNLFYGFLSANDNFPTKFEGKEIKSKLQQARHLITGFEIDLMKNLDLNIEGYVKDFNQLINVNRDKIFDDIPFFGDKPDILRKDYIIETGSAKGIDAVLKYEKRNVYLWFVYSLGFVKRKDSFRTYEPHFDRRHNINAVANYTFGKKFDWEIGARWNFGSGFPFTQTQGFYEYLNLQQGLNQGYVSSNGVLGILYGDYNASRLPYYHRLDLSLKKTFALGKNYNLEVSASVVNVYDRKNIFYFDRVRFKRVNQLPVLPSVGASFTF